MTNLEVLTITAVVGLLSLFAGHIAGHILAAL